MKKIVFAAALAAVSMAATAASSVHLVGAATMVGTDIQLVSKGGSAGAAWLLDPVSTKSFDVYFDFSIRNNGYSPMADGISLALQDGGINAVGTSGGGIGYNGLNAVGSVIQTYTNNKAGLNTDGNAYNTKAAPASLGFANLLLGHEHVHYEAATNFLSMVGELQVDYKEYSFSDSKSIDLFARYGDTVTMGFTGATGASWADERITSYQFQTAAVQAVPEPETYALMLAGLGALGFVARRRKSL